MSLTICRDSERKVQRYQSNIDFLIDMLSFNEVVQKVMQDLDTPTNVEPDALTALQEAYLVYLMDCEYVRHSSRTCYYMQ